MKKVSETTKWADPWFRKLEPEAKMLWLWLLDNCDCAGVIEPDMELAKFQIGATKDLQKTLASLGSRVEARGDKLFIPKFIPYQYGQTLNPENKAHKGVLKRLAEIENLPVKEAPCKPLISPLEGAMEGLISPPRIGIGIGEEVGIRDGYPQEVLDLWAAFPKTSKSRSSKKNVADKWKKLKPKPDIQTVLQSLETWKRSDKWTKDGGQYQEGAHIWLEKQQWENDSVTEAGNPATQQAAFKHFKDREQYEEWTDENGVNWIKVGEQALKKV